MTYGLYLKSSEMKLVLSFLIIKEDILGVKVN